MKHIINLFENYFYSIFNRMGKTFAQECILGKHTSLETILKALHIYYRV